MLDSSTFESMPKEAGDFAKAALGLLASSGVIREQMRINERILISGNAEQTPKALAKQILEFRRVNQSLQTIQELGELYHRESNNAEE